MHAMAVWTAQFGIDFSIPVPIFLISNLKGGWL
jgi:hypothetical protein